MFKIKISARAKKELKQLPNSYNRVIEQSLKELKEDPYIGKPLSQELAGIYSFRLGVYRLLYLIDEQDKKVILLSAGHRATIYK